MQSYINEKRYVPSNYNGHREHAPANCEIFYSVGAIGGKYYGIAYSGKRKGCDWHFSFKTKERLENYIEEYIQRQLANIKYKADLKAKKKELTTKVEVKVGDIFVNSWGYDQTNVDYFQVVELKGKCTAILREIGGKLVEGTSGYMCCNLVPDKDAFVGTERITKRIQSGYNGEPYIAMEFGSGRKVKEGESNYCSWYA